MSNTTQSFENIEKSKPLSEPELITILLNKGFYVNGKMAPDKESSGKRGNAAYTMPVLSTKIVEAMQNNIGSESSNKMFTTRCLIKIPNNDVDLNNIELLEKGGFDGHWGYLEIKHTGDKKEPFVTNIKVVDSKNLTKKQEQFIRDQVKKISPSSKNQEKNDNLTCNFNTAENKDDWSDGYYALAALLTDARIAKSVEFTQNDPLISTSMNLTSNNNKNNLELFQSAVNQELGYSQSKSYTLSDALSLIRTTLLAFTIMEKFGIEATELQGCISGNNPQFIFSKNAFEKIEANNDNDLLAFNVENNSITIHDVPAALNALSGMTVLSKFPYFQKIVDVSNYDNPQAIISDVSLIKRCKQMQKMWESWGVVGMPHLISSLQALCRQVASKAKEPLILSYNQIENGLSVEYQCEIYADQLYGAKLLDIWNHYLFDQNVADRRPENFMNWLTGLSSDQLKKFDISNLASISKVHYIRDAKEREDWKLNISDGNIITSKSLPKPIEPGKKIEVIYALAKSDSNKPFFFGGPKQRGIINHSSFFAGEKVDGAGRIELISKKRSDGGGYDWVIESMDNNSGHIKPTNNMAIITLTRLQELGVDLTTVKWQSKWGSVGLKNETADVALKRLKKEWEKTESLEVTLHKSEIIDHLDKIAKTGKLQDAVNYLYVKQHRILKAEGSAIGNIIYDIINKRLHDSAPPLSVEDLRLASILIKKSLRIIQKSGFHSTALESSFTKIMIEMADKTLTLAMKNESRIRRNKKSSQNEIMSAVNEVNEAEAYLDAARLSSHAETNYSITGISKATHLFKKINIENALTEAKVSEASNMSMRNKK